MKIARIAATPVLIPLEAPYVWSYGQLDGFSKTVVEVETADGATGIGEAPSHGAAAIIAGWAERLIGQDAADIGGLERRCLPFWAGVQSITGFDAIAAFGGLEMALWDLRGKVWGQPVAALLGGIQRREIAFADYFAYRAGRESTPEEVADYCLSLREEFGTTIFEGKVQSPELGDNIRLVAAIRKAVGADATIRIDSNQAFSLSSAVRLAPAFEELGVANWEDPVADLPTMARLRPRTTISFSTHDTDLPKAVATGVPDTIVSDIAGFGGFSRMLGFVSACAEMGVGFWCYSGDGGIGTAAYLHACAAHPALREPNQSLRRWQPDDVIAEPLVPRGNVIALPEGPGLGVTLDRDRLEHCRRLLEERGPPNKHHDPDRPGLHRRMPLV